MDKYNTIIKKLTKEYKKIIFNYNGRTVTIQDEYNSFELWFAGYREKPEILENEKKFRINNFDYYKHKLELNQDVRMINEINIHDGMKAYKIFKGINDLYKIDNPKPDNTIPFMFDFYRNNKILISEPTADFLYQMKSNGMETWDYNAHTKVKIPYAMFKRMLELFKFVKNENGDGLLRFAVYEKNIDDKKFHFMVLYWNEVFYYKTIVVVD
jgi:hypothetical protein